MECIGKVSQLRQVLVLFGASRSGSQGVVSSVEVWSVEAVKSCQGAMRQGEPSKKMKGACV